VLSKKPICLYMPKQGELGVFQLWFAAKRGSTPKWITEVRGKPIREYDPNCPFHKLHDIDRRINLSELHADQVVTILPERNDLWEKVAKFMEETVSV